MDNTILLEKIKIARQNRFINNFYMTEIPEKINGFWEAGDEFVFSYNDHGVNRLVFFVKNWENIDNILDQRGAGKYFLEYVTKNPEQYLPKGASVYARMMRLANADCRSLFEGESDVLKFMNSASSQEALESDSEEINSILWNTFSTEISHLLSEDELKEKIREGQISIHKNTDDKIDAILQAEVMPKKFYINQIVNLASKNVIHSILLNRLSEYVNAGGKYLYAWVEDKNLASQKFHAKYGMKHDGTWSVLYCIGESNHDN